MHCTRLAEVLLYEHEGEGAKPHEPRGEAEEQQPCLKVPLPLGPRCPPANSCELGYFLCCDLFLICCLILHRVSQHKGFYQASPKQCYKLNQVQTMIRVQTNIGNLLCSHFPSKTTIKWCVRGIKRFICWTSAAVFVDAKQLEETSCSCAADASVSARTKEGGEKGIVRHRSVIPQTKRRELSSSEHSLPPPPSPQRVF